MNSITILQSPLLVVGDGCAPGCAEVLARRKFRKVLLVTSTAVRPALADVFEALKRAGIVVVEAAPVDVEPTISMFDASVQIARKENVEAVLGIGGGSAMDVAKLVAALARGRQNPRDVFGINLLQGRELFLACLPTTSGTGSEVSPNAILLDEQDKLKKGVVSPHLVPDAAYVDPLLTVSVPPGVTAATGLDALTHCIEAYANKFSHPITDVYALQGIRLIAGDLLRAVRDGRNLMARANLALGSLLGGLCLGPVNTAAVHALAYPLGGEFHVAHGVSNALLLPHVIRFNLREAPPRYADVAGALGLARNGSDAQAAERGVERLFELVEECGVPRRLSDVGVPREAIPRMARAAMTVTRLLKNNLRPVTEADAVQIYEEAY